MVSPKFYGKRHSHEQALEFIEQLYREGCFDLPLYLAAVHTFKEFNHGYVKKRRKAFIDLVL